MVPCETPISRRSVLKLVPGALLARPATALAEHDGT
jgi:hypothetical protein